MALMVVLPGEVAAIVTTLELRVRPPAPPLPDNDLRLVRWARPDPGKYRALFRRVGAPWLWYSRLTMDDDALCALIHRPETQVHAVIDRAGIEVGLLEFTHPSPDWCQLDYLALVPELTGKGHGRWLMALAMAMMWRPGVEMVRVNTGSLDHPGALNFYRRQGFVPLLRTVETFADPRLNGVLPPEAGLHVPIL